MKAACLQFLRNVNEYKYTGSSLAPAFADLKKACESRRWAMEASMVTEAGLVQWVSDLETAWNTFGTKSKPVVGRDNSVRSQHPDDDNLRAFVTTQITACKAKAEEMQQYRHHEKSQRRTNIEQKSLFPSVTLEDMRACLDRISS